MPCHPVRARGEERFARWTGGDESIERSAFHRVCAEAEPAEASESPAAEIPDDTGVGPAPPEPIAIWVDAIRSMGPGELADFEERTFRQWDPASLGDLRRVIERRRKSSPDEERPAG